MQEEIKVLHHFFGSDIFKCMVLAATNPSSQWFQRLGFDDNDCTTTKRVFEVALKVLFPNEKIACPPVVYFSRAESPEDSLKKIKSASIVQESILLLQFKEDACSRCPVHIRRPKVKYEKDPVVFVEYPDKTILPYKESKCHPCFVPKYTRTQKFFGGVVHIITLGGALAYSAFTGKESWPGFTNSDEMCISCKMSPGATGCGRNIYNERDKIMVTVEHSRKMYTEADI